MALSAKTNKKRIRRTPQQHKPVPSTPQPKKTGQVVATQAMVEELRGEMKREFASHSLELKSVRKEMDSFRKEVESRFTQVDARFTQVDARFTQVDARFTQIDAKLEKVLAAIHRTNALVEEQNARNRYVLDGYTSLYDAQKALEARLKEIEGGG